MQKVSKQSLAMLALSILLAISIALTFTFAATNTSKTATGTISFNNGIAMVFYNDAAVVDDDITFDITVDGSAATDAWTQANKIGLTSTSLPATITATVSGTGEAADGGAVAASLTTSSWEMVAGQSESIEDILTYTVDMTKYTTGTGTVVVSFTAA